MDITKIIDLENRIGFTLPTMDFSTGVLTLEGKKFDCIAVLLDCLLPSDKVEAISAQDSVIKVGTGYYKYAPSQNHHVIYIKA